VCPLRNKILAAPLSLALWENFAANGGLGWGREGAQALIFVAKYELLHPD